MATPRSSTRWGIGELRAFLSCRPPPLSCRPPPSTITCQIYGLRPHLHLTASSTWTNLVEIVLVGRESTIVGACGDIYRERRLYLVVFSDLPIDVIPCINSLKPRPLLFFNPAAATLKVPPASSISSTLRRYRPARVVSSILALNLSISSTIRQSVVR